MGRIRMLRGGLGRRRLTKGALLNEEGGWVDWGGEGGSITKERSMEKGGGVRYAIDFPGLADCLKWSGLFLEEEGILFATPCYEYTIFQ